MKEKISIHLNDTPVELEVGPTERLIDVLRDRLGLSGTKEGCSVGACGACTVLLDGRAHTACLTLAITLDGRHVTTIEGLSSDGRLHPLQKAFISEGGFQCGFCTPGQILAALAVLNEHPDPTDEQLEDGMSGSLCRCTGYYKILESVRAGASELASSSPRTAPKTEEAPDGH